MSNKKWKMEIVFLAFSEYLNFNLIKSLLFKIKSHNPYKTKQNVD